jgi:periplasmic protein TonB
MMAAGLRLYVPTPAVDRRFAVLALLSLLLHGCLLALAGARPSATPPLPPLLATLRLLPLAEPAAPAAAPAPAALPQKVRQSPAVAEARPSPRLLKTAGPASTPAPASAVASETAATADLPAPAAAPVVTVPPVVQPAAASADLLAAYRRRLGELFAGQQDYPRIAALRGWEGEVRLRLRVARKGNLLAVALEHSSGFAVLDQHALALLADLGSLPPLPAGLEDNEIQVVVPITYKLNKTT